MRTLPALLFATLILCAAGLHAPPAAAQETTDDGNGVRCKVYTIAAREQKAPLPKELVEFKDIFSKIPFKAYGSFQLKQSSEVVLSSQKTGKTKLGANLVMTTKLIEKILEGKNKVRYRIQMQIQKETPGKTPRAEVLHNMTIKLAAEKPMFVAGPKENEDTLVIGLICK
jgi:hypothetical protein